MDCRVADAPRNDEKWIAASLTLLAMTPKTPSLRAERRNPRGWEPQQGEEGWIAASLALLDSARTGLVVTAIQGRDYARIYMKELDRGRASIPLSPEEEEAVERAMGR